MKKKILYHTSNKPIHFKDKYPMWFVDDFELAKGWRDACEAPIPRTYFSIFNGKLLSKDEVKEVCKNNGIKYYEFIADLVGNPDNVLDIDGIDLFLPLCDGFYMDDYDPWDFQKDSDSILILNMRKINLKSLPIEDSFWSEDADLLMSGLPLFSVPPAYRMK